MRRVESHRRLRRAISVPTPDLLDRCRRLDFQPYLCGDGPAITDWKGARVTSAARAIPTMEATLTGAGQLDSVDVAYLPWNVEPYINQIEPTPDNYKFPPPS